MSRWHLLKAKCRQSDAALVWALLVSLGSACAWAADSASQSPFSLWVKAEDRILAGRIEDGRALLRELSTAFPKAKEATQSELALALDDHRLVAYVETQLQARFEMAIPVLLDDRWREQPPNSESVKKTRHLREDRTRQARPYVRGKIVVIDKDLQTLSDIHFRLPFRIRAATAEEAETVVWVSNRPCTIIGRKYTDGELAMIDSCEITIIDLGMACIVGHKSWAGGPPPQIKKNVGPGFGSSVDRTKVISYLTNLPRRAAVGSQVTALNKDAVLRERETLASARALLDRAGKAAANGEVVEAIRMYDEVISACAGSEVAKDAMEQRRRMRENLAAASYERARKLQNMGDTQGACAGYRKMIAEFGDTNWIVSAKARLSELRCN